MKILSIQGQNLASLEQEFCIDFTQEPLSSAGIFAITGSTGSGKSTLLDALCLALYNKTPRIALKVDEVQIQDNELATISQTRPSTILRRGATEGYAQVEFMALNGECYRARWSVARAYRKATGKLRDETIQLFNLTKDVEEQGTKSVLLSRIVELIGLSFEQFTRTVLLAQGDFATFLRAKSAEKAQLLEKLTGTEIYADISTAIYRKNMEAQEQLKRMEVKIEAIPLLTPEELREAQAAIAACNGQLSEKQSIQEQLNKRIDWHQTTETLTIALKTVKQQLYQHQSEKEQAVPRYRLMESITMVQQIRESYLRHKEFKELQQQLLAEQARQQIRNTQLNELFTRADQELEKAVLDLNRIHDRFQSIQAQLLKARELDTIMVQKQLNLTKQDSTLAASQQKWELSVEVCKKIEQQIETIRQNQQQALCWFDTHRIYQTALSQLEYIQNMVIELAEHQRQTTYLKEHQQQLTNQLLQHQNSLLLAQEQEEKLENMHSIEVVKLRSMLRDQEPCPVCGSIDHPAVTLQMESEVTLATDQLEEQRRLTRELILRSQEMVNHTQLTLAQNSTSLANSVKLTDTTSERLSQLLQAIPQWQETLDDNRLIPHLQSVKKEWDQLENIGVVLEKQLIQLQTTLQTEQRVCGELEERIRALNSEKALADKEFTVLIAQRNELFEGKSADKIEQEYHTFVNQRNQIVEQSQQVKNRLTTDLEINRNELKRIAGNLSERKEQIHGIDQQLSQWFAQEGHGELREQIEQLISYTPQWIQQEQNALTRLNEQLLTTQIQCEEREKQLTLHLQQFPDINCEDCARLQQQLEELKQVIEQLIRNRSTHEGRVATHENHLELIRHIEKELTHHRTIAQNWGKLNQLLGQSDGGKFKTIAQQYTLDTLLLYANKQLETLADRYRLQRIPDTLSLQIIDREMMDDIRSIVSLSGGESFLISLALALGLSALSSNRMKVESLFIDEGFGSLDPQTLSIVLEALECLHMQGRKIGVISHVTEMNERISTRIEVQKESGGKSRITIV